MLTVDFARLGIQPGTRLLDLGCGAGRHAFEAARRGARVVALDMDRKELEQVTAIAAAMARGRRDPGRRRRIPASAGDATAMPFPDGSFDIVIAAEVMEHIPADQAAMNEVAGCCGRAASPRSPCRPGCRSGSAGCCPTTTTTRRAGTCASSPGPSWRRSSAGPGLTVGGHHHAHALHSPYWWLKCAVGVHDDAHPLAQAYHKLLVWDIMRKPAVTRMADQALNPVIGKSLVVYATKPAARATRRP